MYVPATRLHTRSGKPRTYALPQPLHGCKAPYLLGRFHLPQLQRIFLPPFFIPFFFLGGRPFCVPYVPGPLGMVAVGWLALV
mgnify:CR=1 FL=1